MRPAPLSTVAEVMGGTLAGVPDQLAAAPVSGATTDSRSARGGQLFFALGGRVDGTDVAAEALLRGAVAAVASRPLQVPTVVVHDPLVALGELARWSLPRGEAPKVVGITGTVGKTTTKDALAAILRTSGHRVCATEGNLNNEIGLPLTVLAAPPETEVLVLEMGATHAGDITHLCRIAPPQVGILTAVSPVHLDSFGTLEALAAAKGELALALPEGRGVLVHPTNTPQAATGPGKPLARRITFGDEPEAELYATEVREQEAGLSFTLSVKSGDGRGSVEVEAPVFGTHLVAPMLAASGGALALGMDLEECARGLRRLRRTGLRGEVYRLRDDIIV